MKNSRSIVQFIFGFIIILSFNLLLLRALSFEISYNYTMIASIIIWTITYLLLKIINIKYLLFSLIPLIIAFIGLIPKYIYIFLLYMLPDKYNIFIFFINHDKLNSFITWLINYLSRSDYTIIPDKFDKILIIIFFFAIGLYVSAILNKRKKFLTCS